MYFHTDDQSTIFWLKNVLESAYTAGQRVRFNVDEAGRLSVKRGESVWSAPIESTPDPYRDLSQTPVEWEHGDSTLCNGTVSPRWGQCSHGAEVKRVTRISI